RAAVDQAGFSHTPENGIELRVADVKGVVMALERRVVVEQKRQSLVDLNGREMIAWPMELQSECPSEVLCRFHLVARWHNGVIQTDRHRVLPVQPSTMTEIGWPVARCYVARQGPARRLDQLERRRWSLGTP